MSMPEILAPAGSPDCLPAAVAGGAHAVYLGLRHFNARGRAENFRLADLPDHVAYLHHHGLKCYIVLNTLLHDDEYGKALDMAAAASDAGVDAAIIQDLGLWGLLRRHLPQLPRHASTQMSVHHPSQIAALADLGAERVIVARELSLSELGACIETGRDHGVEIEHFVHGALCYAFSGQCLMSNFAGCRSANRGTCAQNCRFVYEDSRGQVDTHISMRDLSLLDQVSALADAGVASFKIEGRLKGPEYVYAVSSAYARALDAWRNGRAESGQERHDTLRTVFARPFTSTPLQGVYDASSRLSIHQQEDDVADGYLMRLDRHQGQAVLRASLAPRPGQGYTYIHNGFRGGLQMVAVAAAGPDLWQCRVRVEQRGPRIPSGTPLRRNSDQRREQEAQAAMAAVPLARAPRGGYPLRARLQATIGALPRLILSTGDQEVEVCGDAPVQPAQAKALDEASLRQALGQCSGSGYVLREVHLEAPQPAFVPSKVLKALRRHAMQQLPVAAPRRIAYRPSPVKDLTPQRRSTALWVAVASLSAAHAALQAGADQVWLDDPCLRCDDPAQPPQMSLPPALVGRVWLRQGALQSPSPHYAQLGLPVVAGNLGIIRAARAAGVPVMADVHCNACSQETVQMLAASGAQGVVLSLECSAREVARVALRAAAQPAVALIVHGQVPAMLTRQDHDLQPGQRRHMRASQREGGLPYEIERRSGGTTVIWEGRRLASPQHAIRTRGLVDAWVLELADCNEAGVSAITTSYADLLANRRQPEHILDDLEAYAGDGWFAGHLDIGSRALDHLQEQLHA
ncbi:MAG: U32 family peptidase [Planctomycetota bacterium]|nr:MAG: U32 family peptidase [Planctomycetota bacterium]